MTVKRELRVVVDAHSYNLFACDATEWYALLDKLDALLESP